MRTTPLPPGSPGTGSSFIPDSVVPSLSFSFPRAAWDLKDRQKFENKDKKRQDKQILKLQRFIIWSGSIASGQGWKPHCQRQMIQSMQITFTRPGVEAELWNPSSALNQHNLTQFVSYPTQIPLLKEKETAREPQLCISSAPTSA